jgi:hypothetical protein
MAMMASAVMLSGVTSHEPGPGVPMRRVIGADGRVISVGISVALFDLSGFRHMPRGTNLSLPGNQMTVTAQHPYRVAAPRAVKRFEQARKNPLCLVCGLDSPSTEEVRIATAPRAGVCSRGQDVSLREKGV